MEPTLTESIEPNLDSGLSWNAPERNGPITLFDQAWQVGTNAPNIVDFLNVPGPDRAALFVELANVDLMYRLKRRGQDRPAQYYLALFVAANVTQGSCGKPAVRAH